MKSIRIKKKLQWKIKKKFIMPKSGEERNRDIHERMAKKLDVFLQFNEEAILKDCGKVSHKVALALAENEFEKIQRDTGQKS